MPSKNILRLIFTALVNNKNITQFKLRKTVGISRQNLQYYIKQMIKADLITTSKVGQYNVIELTNMGKECYNKNFASLAVQYHDLLTTSRIENHQVQFQCDYVNGEYLAKHAQLELLGKNPYYIFQDIPFDCTLKFTNTKKLIVYIHKQFLKPTVTNLALINRELTILLHEIVEWLRQKQIATVDFATLKDNYLEVANQTIEPLDAITSKQIKVTEIMNRKADGFFNQLEKPAKAWIDKSLDKLEIETNDIEYERKLLLMPENLDRLAAYQPEISQNLILFSNQLKLHLEVLTDMKETMKQIRDSLKK
jgi:predicted transcriptional regulator